MKKPVITLTLVALCALGGASAFTPRSLLFSDSYMLQAKGWEANYWNPALLNKEFGDVLLPTWNLGAQAGNNSFDLELYNHIMSREHLEDADKQLILDSIDGSVAVNAGSQIPLLGFTVGNLAFSSSARVATKAAFDEKYLELLLYGNGDGSEVFEFTKEDTWLEALSYLDLTLGWGNIRLPLPKSIPDIKFGLALSGLAGIGSTSTEIFDGRLSANLDGLSFRQDVLQSASLGGYGAKGLIGLYSEPVKNLHVGATLDNILGFIRWNQWNQDFGFHIQADSLYALDLLEQGGTDLITIERVQDPGEPYTTTIPMEMRLAAMYRIKQIALSADFIKGFGDSAEISRQLRFAVGAEVRLIPFLSLFLGYGSGTPSYPWRTSLGLGLNLKSVELGVGIQTIEQLFPGYNTKGLALATFFRVRT